MAPMVGSSLGSSLHVDGLLSGVSKLPDCFDQKRFAKPLVVFGQYMGEDLPAFLVL